MDQIHLIVPVYLFVCLIQAYFLFRHFIPFVFDDNQCDEENQRNETVSVIICAHNELQNLQQNLILFLKQDFHDYEVIVVNDRSTDGSLGWLDSQKEHYHHLNVMHIYDIPDNFNSKKYAITKGIEVANGDIVLLSDADCWPASDQWVDRMSRSFTDSTTIVLGASIYEKRKEFVNQFIRFETLQTALLYLSFAYKREAYMGVGRNLAYRKSYFLENDGFKDLSSIMGGDDDLWVNRHSTSKNTQICTHPESLTISSPKETWISFFIQKRRHLSVGKYYKNKNKIKLGLFHFTQSLVFILYILGLLLGSSTDCLILSSLFLMYVIGQYVVFYKLSIKFGIIFAQYNLLILEILFIGYFWIWGFFASLSKHLKWK